MINSQRREIFMVTAVNRTHPFSSCDIDPFLCQDYFFLYPLSNGGYSVCSLITQSNTHTNEHTVNNQDIKRF